MRSIILATGTLCFGWCLLAAAFTEPASDAACCVASSPADPAAAPTTAPSTRVDAKKAFEEIKTAAVGKWKLDPAAPDQGFSGKTEFKLTAGGSVIMETMLPGTKMEMVNLFALDGEDLLVTHYCAGGNQPRMKLASVEKGVYTFEFKDGTNITPGGQYMGKLALTIADGKLVEDWTNFDKGQAGERMHLPLVRE